jgi:hypothetical protein
MKISGGLMALVVIICAAIVWHAKEQSKPELPVSVNFRHAILGQGLVAQFRNNSGAALEVALKLTRPATNTYQSEVLELPSTGVTEVGPLDGWMFVAGQDVELRNVSYRPMKVIVPGGDGGSLRSACPVITTQYCSGQTGPALRTCIEQNRSKFEHLSPACTRLLDGG